MENQLKELLKEEILEKTYRTEEEFLEVFLIIKNKIKLIPEQEFEEFLNEACNLFPQHLKDAAYLALALKYKCSIWSEEKLFKNQNKIEIFMESFRTEARWEKAIQHLKEKGELENQPKDIGKLFKEVQEDIEGEERENVKEFLWQEFKGALLRKSTAGLPQWYKEKLAKESFIE